MIDFSKYTLTELQAMSAVLDDLTYRMSISDTMKAHMLPYHYYKEVTGAVAAAIDQQALDAAGDPPASNPPAEGPEGLQVVDTLSWCSNRLAALAAAEDKHFAECSQTEVFNKVTMLRECKQALNNMVSDIRDHYDGLH